MWSAVHAGLALVLATPIAATTSTIPRFIINLDEPPEDRWKEWVLYFKEKGLWDPYLTQNLSARMSHDREQDWLQALLKVHDEDYLREFDGMCKWIGHPACNASMLMMHQSIYEQMYPTFCSGVLVADENGKVTHGRNMDYPLQFEIGGKMWGWAELTTTSVYMKGGKKLFSSVAMLFGVNVHTGIRLDGSGWSFQQNTRLVNNTNAANLAAIKQGALPFAFAIRRVMERVPDYETAVEELQKIHLAAPNYFMVAGPKPYQGAIISVDRFGRREEGTPPPLTLSPKRRYLLQTNDDMNAPPMDYRRPFEHLRLSYLPADASMDYVLQQMLTKPLLNSKTVFTTVYQPATSFEETYNAWDDFKKVPTKGRLDANFMQAWTTAVTQTEDSMKNCFYVEGVAWKPCIDQIMQTLGATGPRPPPGTPLPDLPDVKLQLREWAHEYTWYPATEYVA